MTVQVKTERVYEELAFLDQSRFISKTIQDMAIVATKDEHEIVCDLLNGAIFNDLERP